MHRKLTLKQVDTRRRRVKRKRRAEKNDKKI